METLTKTKYPFCLFFFSETVLYNMYGVHSNGVLNRYINYFNNRKQKLSEKKIYEYNSIKLNYYFQ